MEKDIEDYINAEFSIRIFKESGKENTTQIYNGTKAEIGTCIASMIEQLLVNGIFTPDEMFIVIDTAITKIKNKNKGEI